MFAAPRQYAHAFVRRYRPSLAECLDHPSLRFDMANVQTRMLGWHPNSSSEGLRNAGRAPWGEYHKDSVDYIESEVDEA
jgi:hypothetical protein